MTEKRCDQCGRTTYGRTMKTYVGGRVLCKALRECRQITANIRVAQALEFEWLYKPSEISLFRSRPRSWFAEQRRAFQQQQREFVRRRT